MAYTHYIVVRRDLPKGAMCAQVAHAAGESFYDFCRGSSVDRALAGAVTGRATQEVAGSIPAPGSTIPLSSRPGQLPEANVSETLTEGANLSTMSSRPSEDATETVDRAVPPSGAPIHPAISGNGGSNPLSTATPGSSVDRAQGFGPEVASLILAPATNIDPSRTTVVVLGARNEHRLVKLEAKLVEHGIAHNAIREPDHPYNGQLMAIGLHPLLDRDAVRHLLRDFQIVPDESIAPNNTFAEVETAPEDWIPPSTGSRGDHQ